MTRFVDANDIADNYVPAVLAPAGELLLDALPPVRRAEDVIELGSSVGIFTEPLKRYTDVIGANLVPVDHRRELFPYLPDGLLPVESPGAGRLPDPFRPVQHIISNCGFIGDDALETAAADSLRVLLPAGTLTFTTLLDQTFDGICNLLIDACRSAGLPRWERAVRKGRDRFPKVERVDGVLKSAGFRILSHGVVEHAILFPDGDSVVSDSFVRKTALAHVFDGGPATDEKIPVDVWARVAEFIDSAPAAHFSVQIRIGIFRAEKTKNGR